MNKNRLHLFELVLNVLTVALIGYVSTNLLRQHFNAHQEKPFTLLSPGSSFPLKGVDWTKSPRTLVLAISTGCHFCADSAPFYQALLKEQIRTNWHAVAVLPQPVDAAKIYMQLKGYSVMEVYQGDFNLLGISATPALLLVDQQGKVLQEWIGRLSIAEENDVAMHLGIKKLPEHNESAISEHRDEDSPLVTTDRLLAMLESKEKIQLLDIREKTKYEYGHIAGAINAPLGELFLTKGEGYKLSLEKPTIIYCHFSSACQFNGLPSLCANGAAELRNLKIANVRVIRDSLPLLHALGVAIKGKWDQP